MIRYLDKEEYGACIPLWQEAFPEDSREFLEYYFGRKIKESRILVKEDGEGRILTMVHLNPYDVMVGGQAHRLSYIVGVATAAGSRHQGHMRDVLVRMLQDMHGAGDPFCYLMPASPDIYRPFGFTYVFDQPLWRLDVDEAERPDGTERPDEAERPDEMERPDETERPDGTERPDEAERPVNAERLELRLDEKAGTSVMDQEYLADWMNRWLKERYQVYARRDAAYLDLLQAELDSENGRVFGWMDGQGNLAALQAYWGTEKREQRFLYCSREDWVGPADPQRPGRPAIMARIADVRAFMEMITVNSGCPCPVMEVPVRIHDTLISGNDGLWTWRVGRDSSKLLAASPAAGQLPGKHWPAGHLEDGSGDADILISTEVLDITVDRLMAWLSGYSPLDAVLEDAGEPPFWHGYIKPLEGIFLDEIV